jgi:D-alanine-D-alanine ligase
MSEYIVPADVPKDVFEKLQLQALLAFKSLGCEGYGRIDFRVNSKWEIYCLEINTLPGMTSTSLVPKMAKAVRITFEELIDRIIKLNL